MISSTRIFIGLTITAISLVAACSKGGASSSWMSSKNSRDYVNMALDSDSPDTRREGVQGLAASPDAQSDWAAKIFDTIARTDSNSAVRSAAVKALAASNQPQAAQTIIKILKTPTETFPDVKPAAAPLRWETAKALDRLVVANNIDSAQQQGLLKVLLDRLNKETDRNVRLSFIETLGRFKQRPVPETLIDLLNDEDFAITRAAENSPIALTGVTHHQNAAQWREWLAKSENPFAHAGELPPDAEIKSRSNWDW